MISSLIAITVGLAITLAVAWILDHGDDDDHPTHSI